MVPNPVVKIDGKWHAGTILVNGLWKYELGPFDTSKEAWDAFREYINKQNNEED